MAEAHNEISIFAMPQYYSNASFVMRDIGSSGDDGRTTCRAERDECHELSSH